MSECSICGRYIKDGYNVSRYNLERHEQACPEQMERERRRGLREASILLTRSYRAAGVALPLAGQLSLPGVEGVVEVVSTTHR